MWQEMKDWYNQSERQYTEFSMKIQNILSEQHEFQSSGKKSSSEMEKHYHRLSKDKIESKNCSLEGQQSSNNSYLAKWRNLR